MRILLWYVAVGMIITFIDIMNERRKSSKAYMDLIEIINFKDDQYYKRGFIFAFVSMLSLLWPVNLTAMLMRLIRDTLK